MNKISREVSERERKVLCSTVAGGPSGPRVPRAVHVDGNGKNGTWNSVSESIRGENAILIGRSLGDGGVDVRVGRSVGRRDLDERG
jgi:hypothetical protein